MDELRSLVSLAERVADAARQLGIETALIGAAALAVHNYTRGTNDLDLATNVDPLTELPRLEQRVTSLGLHARLHLPDGDDALGGVLKVWEHEDEDGDPTDAIDVVNFYNPHRPVLTPGADAVEHAESIAPGSALRCVRLPDLVALKLYARSLRDDADVVELLVNNPAADLEAVRATSKRYGLDRRLEELIATAAQRR